MKDYEVVLVVQNELPENRRNCGWSVPILGLVRVITAPLNTLTERLLSEREFDSIHLFSGIRAYPLPWKAFQLCATTRARMGIVSEAHNWHGVKGKLVLVRGKVDVFRYRRRIDFIMAIGQLGTKWFELCGFPKSKIYPFAYVVETPTLCDCKTRLQDRDSLSKVVLCYIGQLVSRKGIDILVKALADLKFRNWTLHLVGDGPEKGQLKSLVRSCNLDGSVSFHGRLDNAEAMRILAGSDLLILPSRWDGWGAVVNEALMRGIPAICTDRSGASDLLRGSYRGSVVEAGSVCSLNLALQEWLTKGPIDSDLRLRIREWSKCIQGQTVAEYLSGVIKNVIGNGSRPVCPWSNTESCSPGMFPINSSTVL